MTTTTEAIYENGFLRLLTPVTLNEGAHVQVTLITLDAGDKPSPFTILKSIAAMPVNPTSVPFSGSDHDRILYGTHGGE